MFTAMRSKLSVGSIGFLGLVVASSSVACSSSSSDSPSTCMGAERCDCYPNHTCNDGLACLSNMCVAVSPGAGGVSGGHGGAVIPPLGAGGVTAGTGGVAVPPVGVGGAAVPPVGVGGAIVPPLGTGGAVISPLGTGGSAGGTNLLKNGDFSQGKLYWDLTLQAGDVGGYSYSGGQYCVFNESSSLYLSFSLGYPSSPSDAFAVEAGATYVFSYQVTGYGSIEAKVGGAVTPYPAVASFKDASSSSLTGQTFAHFVTPTASVAQTGLVFNGTLDYLGSVCFDNASFVKY
jgi:hypothetical protein